MLNLFILLYSSFILFMYPILARYGTFFLYTYTVVWGIGILFSFFLLKHRIKKISLAFPFDSLLIGAVGGLIAGRASFVLANWDYFQQNSGEVFQLWRGGLGYQATLLTGLELFVIGQLWQRKNIKESLWLIAPLLPILSAVGWTACYFEGCAFGTETMLGGLSADLPNHLGVFAIRYQTQLIGVIGSLLIFVLIELLRKQPAKAYQFWLALGLTSLQHGTITLLRADKMLMLFGQRLDVLLDGLLLLITLFGFLLTISHNTSHGK